MVCLNSKKLVKVPLVNVELCFKRSNIGNKIYFSYIQVVLIGYPVHRQLSCFIPLLQTPAHKVTAWVIQR